VDAAICQKPWQTNWPSYFRANHCGPCIASIATRAGWSFSRERLRPNAISADNFALTPFRAATSPLSAVVLRTVESNLG
jgi:hypothetical protein